MIRLACKFLVSLSILIHCYRSHSSHIFFISQFESLGESKNICFLSSLKLRIYLDTVFSGTLNVTKIQYSIMPEKSICLSFQLQKRKDIVILKQRRPVCNIDLTYMQLVDRDEKSWGHVRIPIEFTAFTYAQIHLRSV